MLSYAVERTVGACAVVAEGRSGRERRPFERYAPSLGSRVRLRAHVRRAGGDNGRTEARGREQREKNGHVGACKKQRFRRCVDSSFLTTHFLSMQKYIPSVFCAACLLPKRTWRLSCLCSRECVLEHATITRWNLTYTFRFLSIYPPLCRCPVYPTTARVACLSHERSGVGVSMTHTQQLIFVATTILRRPEREYMTSRRCTF